MICLLLIMTMIFINSTDSAEQKVRHSDTLLKEEDMNAKTKAWLLMVESGKVDQEELRRITPKSIFIAPLLSSRAGKCKEGYRHDHLGQCVKVIKIDPQLQLELLLQKLNKLYGDKEKEEQEAEKEELFQVSSGPLHFSLPISSAEEKPSQTTSDTKSDAQQLPTTTANTTSPEQEEQNVSEFLPIPLPMVNQNQTNQTKEFESSGAGPANDTEQYETAEVEGSGYGHSASGDGFQDEELTTSPPVRIVPEETDYYDATETNSTPSSETHFTTEVPDEDFTTTEITLKDEVLLEESYQNITGTSTVNMEKNGTEISPKQNVTTLRNNSNSEKIYFPSDDDDYRQDNNGGGDSGSTVKLQVYSTRIRFPDEVPQEHLSFPDSSSKASNYQIHSSTIPREQFWWLPKNWEIDENQHKSPLFKVWSRLPLIHDITYARDTGERYEKSPPVEKPPPQTFNPQHAEAFTALLTQQQPPSRNLKPFKSSRFQDILITPRQNFRFQR